MVKVSGALRRSSNKGLLIEVCLFGIGSLIDKGLGLNLTFYVYTRISGRYAPLILAPAQGSTHLHHVLLNNFFSLNY